MRKLLSLLLASILFIGDASVFAQTQIGTNQIQNGAITNAKVNVAAAIDWSKISKVGAVPGDIGAAAALTYTSPLTLTGSTLSLGIVPANLGGTGRATLTTGQIPFGNGTSPLGLSANFKWDSTNNRLCIMAPAVCSYALDVNGTARATTFLGNLTGNVTGNLTGNVTGNVIGNVTGSSSVAGGFVTTGAPVVVSGSAPPTGAGYAFVSTSPTTATWQLVTGIAGSGNATQVAYFTSTTNIASNASYVWNNTSKQLLVGGQVQTGTVDAASVDPRIRSYWNITSSGTPSDVNSILGGSMDARLILGYTGSAGTGSYNATRSFAQFDTTWTENATLLAGALNYGVSTAGGGAVTTIAGTSSFAYANGVGSATWARGVQSQAGSLGASTTVTNAASFYARSPFTTGTTTNVYGVYVENQAPGVPGVSTTYQLYSTGAATSRFVTTSNSIVPLGVQLGAVPTADAFQVLASDGTTVLGAFGPDGGLRKLRGVTYVWPAANAVGVATNDGSGNITWTPPVVCTTCVTSAAVLGNNEVLIGDGARGVSTVATTGSGNFVRATSPSLVTPNVGVATATSINGLTITASTGILTITNAKTLSISNTLTFAGTDGSTLNIGTGGTLGTNAYTSTAYAPIASPTFTGTVTIPTPFTLGATSVTSTGTQLNYLSAATGTTGTTSTNLVFSTSPTLISPALGTPTALVGTNITGTASGFTAGNVTTNANLTGPITSVGNATSVASQTGTGSVFAMQVSPAFTTPNIGVATATSVSIGATAFFKFEAGNPSISLRNLADNAYYRLDVDLLLAHSQLIGTNVIRENSNGVAFVSSAQLGAPGGLRLANDNAIAFSSTSAYSGSADLFLYREAAQTLVQRNSTNAQIFKIYNTWTDASNGEWLELKWASNLMGIKTTKNGSGTLRELQISSGGRLYLDSTAEIQFTVSGSPKWVVDSGAGAISGTNFAFAPVADSALDIGSSTRRVQSIYFAGGLAQGYVAKTGTYTLTSNDTFVNCDTTSGSFTLTLPAASVVSGRTYHIKKTGAANTCTIARAGSDTIDGATSIALTVENESRSIIGDGTSKWLVF